MPRHAVCRAVAVTLLSLGLVQECRASGNTGNVRLELEAGQFSLRDGAASTEQALAENWGQFELQVPKQKFALQAPNCRGSVTIRMIGIAPDAVGRDRLLRDRWSLLRRLADAKAGETVAIQLRTGPRYYTRTDRDGRVVLRYCNAFSDGSG